MRFHYSLPAGSKLGLSQGKESCKIPKKAAYQKNAKKYLKLIPSTWHMPWGHCVSTWSAMGKRGSLALLYVTWPDLGEVGSLACSPMTCTSKLSPNPPPAGEQNTQAVGTQHPHVSARTGWTHAETVVQALHIAGLIHYGSMQLASEMPLNTSQPQPGMIRCCSWQNFSLGKNNSLDCRSESHYL